MRTTGVAVRRSQKAHFLCLHEPQERGTRFLFLTIRYWASGDRPPPLDDAVDGGVGVIGTV